MNECIRCDENADIQESPFPGVVMHYCLSCFDNEDGAPVTQEEVTTPADVFLTED